MLIPVEECSRVLSVIVIINKSHGLITSEVTFIPNRPFLKTSDSQMKHSIDVP